MTDETYERICEYVKRHHVPDPHGNLGRLVHIPLHVSEDVPDDAPELSVLEPYREGIRLSPDDFDDLKVRLEITGWPPSVLGGDR